ncbi:MAG: DNA polymerase IV [Actinomycetaceae bacterium]|nr:DNA polymerase IV [Actinomycetaceae bacterium]MDU0970032.1 DNA polymerase IV [Actinomycetaceae bacterium]
MSTAPRLSAAKRDWGDDDSSTPILHVDMDAFFVEVELLRAPHLRGHPVIVGGSSMRGVVSSASYEARAMGVHAGQPISQARRICPRAVVLPTSHGVYAEVSRQVMEILGRYTPKLERVSVDEAFLDVSGARRLWGSPTQIGHEIRRTVRAELGLPASVGIAATKLVAKIASSHAKPDGLLLVPQERTVEFLHMLPVGALWGVGPRTRAQLERRGIRTIKQLAEEPESSLVSMLGEAAGHHLHDLAWGIDPRDVAEREREKSIGTESTFPTDITDRDVLDSCLLDQAYQTAARLRAAGLGASTISIKVRMADFSTLTRSRTLPVPTDVGRDIAQVARDLLASLTLSSAGVRLVGVRAENLRPAAGGWQASLLDDTRVRQVEGAWDAVARRFGDSALTPARLLQPPTDGRE